MQASKLPSPETPLLDVVKRREGLHYFVQKCNQSYRVSVHGDHSKAGI